MSESPHMETAHDLPEIIYLPHLPPPGVVPGEKKRPKRNRGHVDHFRTSDEEHAELASRARAEGLSVDAYCRLKTLGNAGLRSKRAQPTAASKQRAEHITAINRIGNLINQGIHALNRIDHDDGPRDRLADEVAAAREILAEAMPLLREALAAAVSDDVREG